MEQHPIPQQISSYQFKLVGDMTLKQFFQVAGGVIVSLIFYSTPLHPIIKWPFILFSAGMGAALAFLPFEERPLERWIFAFFRSIYSPTLYFWKKTEKPPVFFTETAASPAITTVDTLNVPDTALNAVPIQSKDINNLEIAEKTFLQKIGGLFSITSTANGPQTTAKQTTVTSNAAVSVTFTKPVLKPVINEVKPSTVVHQPLSVPSQIPTVITKSAPKLVVEESLPITSYRSPITNVIAGEKIEEKPITSNVVEFSVDAAPPSPPIAINTITGQVMDQDRKIIEGTILEIKDSNGRPVRALKSNKAGHFIIVTPLQNGKYEVTIEKEGFTFEPVSFDAVGNMIPAIAIRGTRTA